MYIASFSGANKNKGSIKMAETNANLSIKVNVDVAEAITGLKALQREAKETVRVLRELEGVNSQPITIIKGERIIKKHPFGF